MKAYFPCTLPQIAHHGCVWSFVLFWHLSLSLANQRSAWAVIPSASILASLAMTLGDCLELSDQLQFPLGFRILVPRAYILGSPSIWNIDGSWSLYL